MISKLEAIISRPKVLFPAVALLIFLINIPVILKDDGNSNAYVLLSKSMMEGKIALPEITGFAYMDMITYQEKHFLPYPPFPAMVLLPAAAFAEDSYVPSSIFAVIASLLIAYFLYRILIRLDLQPIKIFWLLIGFILGSPFWYILTTSNYHYGFAQILACLFSVWFIYEYYHQRRPALLALFIGLGFLCRQSILFYCIFFLANNFWNSDSKPVSWKQLIQFGLVLSFFGITMAFYNYLRFGNLFTSGYQYINYIEPLASRVEEYGVFSWQYIPFNFYSTFIKGHNLIFGGDGLIKLEGIDIFGTSLTVASPFIFIAFKAKAKPSYLIATIAAILPILIIHLMYHNNGFHQINTSRFALDYFPLLFLLIAIGARNVKLSFIRALICYSVALNVFSFIVYQLYQ